MDYILSTFILIDLNHFSFDTLLLVGCLPANWPIHIGKNNKNDTFPVKNGLFICEFKMCGSKWRNVYKANNEGNLYS